MEANVNIERVQLSWLNPAEYNPRKRLRPGDAEYERLKTSIQQFGYVDPIICNADGTIIGGHQRFFVLRDIGAKEADVSIVDLDKAKEKALNIALNKISGDWNDEKLKTLLQDLDAEGFELSLTGFSDDELSDLLGDVELETDAVEDDYDFEKEVPARAKIHEVWQLGVHRLICGDSTELSVIDRLMDGVKADMVFTDPPYGMKKESEGVLNDNLNFDDLLDFNRQWIPLTFGALKDNGSWYCWGIDEPLMDIYSNILKPMQKENKITFRNLITWDKGDAGAGGVSFMGKDGLRSYPVGSEKCLFVMCGVQGFNNNQDNYFEGWEPVRQYLVGEAEKVGLTPQKLKEICGVGMWSHWFGKSQFAFITEEHYKELQDYYSKKEYDAFKKEYDAFKKEYDELKKEYDELKKEYYSTRAYFDNTHDTMTDVWAMGRISHEEKMQAGGHATPKPIALCSRAIKSSSREGEIVLDVFGGSGSTLIACEQLNRKCYMAELDPFYCDVIIDRWEKFTGKKAKRIK